MFTEEITKLIDSLQEEDLIRHNVISILRIQESAIPTKTVVKYSMGKGKKKKQWSEDIPDDQALITLLKKLKT